MHDQLKRYCLDLMPFSEAELDLVDDYFQLKTFRKKDYLLCDGEVCSFIGFLTAGSVRHFHIRDDEEKTCDISFENHWVTDFKSFTSGSPAVVNLQALEGTAVLAIEKSRLSELYQECGKYETFARIMAERVAHRATDIAMSLSSNKPSERYRNLIRSSPELFRRIPQKYIADFLGITPESLSRIRKRVSRM